MPSLAATTSNRDLFRECALRRMGRCSKLLGSEKQLRYAPGLRKFSFSLADTEEETVLIARKNAGVLT